MEPNWAPCTRIGQPNGHNEGPYPDLAPLIALSHNNQGKKKEEFIVGNLNNYKYHFCWIMNSMILCIRYFCFPQKKMFVTRTGRISMVMLLTSAEENYRATCLPPHSIKKMLSLLSHCEPQDLGISLHELKEPQASSWDKHRKLLPRAPTQTKFSY